MGYSRQARVIRKMVYDHINTDSINRGVEEMKPVFREVTTSYDSRYGAFTGTILAMQTSSLSIITGDGLYPVVLENGRAIRFVNVPIQRINVNGRILIVGMDHEYRVNIAPTIELGGQIFELSSAPSIESRLDAIDNDINNIAGKLDANLSDLASESTLTQVNVKLSQPTALHSSKVTIDNSAGSDPLIQQLFASSTPSRQASIHRDPTDTGVIYVGDSTAQAFPINPGDTITTYISDLSIIYINVPAGVIANLYVLWES